MQGKFNLDAHAVNGGLNLETVIARIELLQPAPGVRQAQPLTARGIETSAVIREGHGQPAISPLCGNSNRRVPASPRGEAVT